MLRAGQTRFLALFASDGRGTVSVAARRVVSLASLVPLRPLTGSLPRDVRLLAWVGCADRCEDGTGDAWPARSVIDGP